MLSSKIKPNMEVTVYLEGSDLVAPASYPTHSGALDQPYWQQKTARGLPIDYRSARCELRATVVATGVEMAASKRGTYSRFYNREKGVLVRLAEPMKVRDAEVTEVVVLPKRVLETWEETAARRARVAEANAAQQVRLREASVGMAQRLAEFRAQLEAIGLESKLHNDVSGLYGNGFSLSLSSSVIDGERRPTSWGDSGVRIDRTMFEKLVAIAAKHGERLDA